MTCPSYSFIPGGFTTNPNLCKTHFGRRLVFEQQNNVRMLVDKISPYLPGKIHERYPSIYTKDVSDLPGWLAFDKQILVFDAYFQETLHDSIISPIMLRICKIYFYLEDGTIKINEPKVKNSGMVQGNILTRSRISLPPPKDEYFYDIIDFNIGKEIEIHSRHYKIVNCDKFTRTFLNRLGITVPDPITLPDDPYMIHRKKEYEKYPKKPKDQKGNLIQMYEKAGQVLRFYGYWDDTGSSGGYVHHLTIHYYLMDDTIEVVETQDQSRSLFAKRSKVFKNLSHLPEPGFFEDLTLLNVMGNGKYKTDLLNPGRTVLEYVTTKDLAIGSAINLHGRKIVLVDCDEYTKSYYNKTYGVDNFTPMEKPKEPTPVEPIPLHKRKLPPWNGYGTFIDSAQNCITVEPKAIMRDVQQFLKLDRDGYDSHILRFKARNRARPPLASNREFIICYYLSDNTMSIHEMTGQKAGPSFMKRMKVQLPGQEVYVSEEPDYFNAQHLYVGATLDINGFIFILIDADEYALRYMEINCDQFPKSNIKLIMDKVRKVLRPIYHEFLAKLNLKGSFIEFDVLREKLLTLLGDDFTEHEMLTLARFYSAACKKSRHSREYIRSLVQTDLRRNLWQDLDRFKECFNHYDIYRTGFLTRKEIYNLIRGCKLPLDTLLINSMLDVLNKNEKCDIKGQDLFDFIDENVGQQQNMEPISQMSELSWSTEPEITAGKIIDWCKLAEDVYPEIHNVEKKSTRQG